MKFRVLILKWRLKRALAKRDTLLDEVKIDKIDEKIWTLKCKLSLLTKTEVK